jgi:glycosyltransferase involved in cell wall biosynthesis
LRRSLETKHIRNKNIKFLGLRDDIPEILAASDVFILTSNIEGSPQTLIEAMAMENAVIASKVGDVSVVVRDSVDGLLFKPGDMTRAKALLSQVIKDKALRLRLTKNARIRVVTDYNLNKMSSAYTEMYNELISQK